MEQAVRRLDRYREEYQGEKRVEIIPGPDEIFSNSRKVLANGCLLSDNYRPLFLDAECITREVCELAKLMIKHLDRIRCRANKEQRKSETYNQADRI